MPGLINTGPQGDAANPKAQLAEGPPRAPMKKQPKYQENTTAILGTNPLDEQNGGAVSPGEGGTAGVALASVAMMIKGAQNLSMLMPGIIPQEVTMWLQGLLQAVPQAIQQQSQFGGGPIGGGGMSGVPQQGMQQPPQQAPAMSMLGGGGGPQQGAGQPPQRPMVQ